MMQTMLLDGFPQGPVLFKWCIILRFVLTIDSESCLKLVLLKQNFIHGFLNWSEVEVGLSYNYVGIRKIYLQKSRSKITA